MSSFESTTPVEYFKMKILFLTVAVLLSINCKAEDKQTDSLMKVFNSGVQDSVRVDILNQLSKQLLNSEGDKSFAYAQQAKDLAVKTNYKSGLAYAYKYMGIGYFNTSDYLNALKHYELALDVFKSIDDKRGIANMYSNIGNIYYNKGDDDKALELYLLSQKFAEEIKDTLRILTAVGNVGAIYGKKKQTHNDAVRYYRMAYSLALAIADSRTLGNNALNLGEVFMAQSNYDSALYYFNISLPIFKGSEDAPYVMNDIGAVYMLQKKYDKAIEIQKNATQLSESYGSKFDLGVSLISLGKSYLAKGDLNAALAHFKRGEKIASDPRADYTLLEVYKGLSKIYTEKKDFGNATKYQALLMDIKDSIYNLETDKKLGTLQFTFDLDKKESQISLLTKDNEIQDQIINRQKIVRNSFIAGFIIMLVATIVFFIQRNKIKKEKHRSEELLLNILPEETAEELKATGTAKTKSYQSVSVLFTDFKNFTSASERLTPEELVQEINLCYCEFDRIVTKHNLEKIKTIGDSYMCAGGLPEANSTNAVDAVNAALEMQHFMFRHKEEKIAKGLPYFELRLGIHTGPVVAGIVGLKKFAYDIWGDTVNTASRMESSGEVGKVNISEVTYNLVKDKFHCTHRGKIQAKNKGEIDMYFVETRITPA